MEQVASQAVANRKILFGIQNCANFRFVGTGCGKCSVANLAKFARVVAKFARKYTNPPQKSKANVEISPICESEIELGKPGVNP